MRIRHKKTGWEGTVDQLGWGTIKRAGLDKNYEIIDRTDQASVENVILPPEVQKFQGKLQQKQQEAESISTRLTEPGDADLKEEASEQKPGQKKSKSGEQTTVKNKQ